MRCRVCRNELREQARFCDACGAAIAAGFGAQARDPREYTPRHLAARILNRRSSLEGEHKHVTVLFVDVQGSMLLAESVDLELWHRIMNRFFDVVCDVVHRYEGTINQFTGDGVMALFGAPIAHEDHAPRACFAALALRDALRAYAEEVKRSSGLAFATRMGLNSGEVVVGRIGDDLRMDYTAQGQVVGLAARMEQLADAGSIYASDATAELARGFVRLRDLGEFSVKGARGPVRVHEVVEAGSLRTRFDASRSRGLTRFVGRAGEIASLEAALVAAEDGRGGVVGIAGEPGVGKSRLCWEFGERCRARRIPVRSARALPYGDAVPFLPLLEMLRGIFGVTDRDPPGEARQKIAGAVLLLDTRLTSSLPLFFEFLGVPDPRERSEPLDPEARQERLIDAVMRLLRARGARGPLVLLIEDLHWIDPGSAAFLARLVEIAPTTRTLVVLNYRPEYRAEWMGRVAFREVPLAPLGETETRELVDELIGADPGTLTLRRDLRDRSGGNPFFAEEAVRALIDAGQLVEGERGWVLARPVERLVVPASVHSVVSARIDRLSEPEKLLLQTAAAIGPAFSEPLLRRVSELPDPTFDAALQDLEDGGFLQQEALYPEREYGFRHPLVMEVAYAIPLADDRARIHAAVADALEALQPERLDENAPLLARHAEAAGRPLDAARWHRRAAGWLGVRDVVAAQRHWEAVIRLLADAPASDECTELELQAHLGIQQLAWRLGATPEETAAIFQRGVSLAERRGDRPAVALLALSYAVYRGVVGDEEGQYRCGIEAAEIADSLESVPLSLASRVVMATSLHFQGRLRDALEVADWAVAHRPEDPIASAEQFGIGPYTYILGLRGLLVAMLGHFERGSADLESALELAQECGDAEALGCVHGFAVQHARCAGDTAAALGHGRSMLEVAERTGIPLLLVDAWIALGTAHLLGGQWEDALAALDRGLRLVDARRILLGPRRRILAALSEAWLGLGELERARHLASELLACDGIERTWLVELSARLVVARALVRSPDGPGDAVHAALSRCVELVGKSGARVFEPEIHRTLAELAQREDDEPTRVRHLREAHRLYRDMAAGGHVARLARLLDETDSG